MPMKQRKYTLIYHYYLGHNWYNIELKRVKCSLGMLERYKTNPALHFVMKGWPATSTVDGTPYFKGGAI